MSALPSGGCARSAPAAEAPAEARLAAGASRCEIRWLGRVPYAEALALQEERVEARRRSAVGDALWLLEHPPVITFGRRGREEHLRCSRAELRARGVEIHRVSRGGDVTFHGPGQLVGYLVLDLAARGLADVSAYLRALEAVLIEALGDLGLEGYACPGRTGVFVGPGEPGPPRKIASIGVGLRGWVTWHGFALNATLDLAAFDAIVPCGLADVAMTSVARELGEPPSEGLDTRVRARVAARVAAALDRPDGLLAARASLR